MKKISEMTMSELSRCMCAIAEPAERLFSDGAVTEAFAEANEKIGEKAPVKTAFSIFSAVLFPVLTGEKHKQDTYAILSALTDQKAEEIENRNGVEVMRDLFAIFVVDGEVQSMFQPCAEVRRK